MNTTTPRAPSEREAIARVLWDRLRERLRGHRGRRIMPEWDDALPEERSLYLSDADAILALRPPAPESEDEDVAAALEDEWLGTTGAQREDLFAALHSLTCSSDVSEIPEVMARVISIVRPSQNGDEIRAIPLDRFAERAASINDSDALMAVYAAPEWDELGDDGKQWVCALVRETLARNTLPRALSPTPATDALREVVGLHFANVAGASPTPTPPPEEVAGLVERLRECATDDEPWSYLDGIEVANRKRVIAKAADAIASLSAQVAGEEEEVERQEELAAVYRRAQLTAEEKLCREQANAAGWKIRAEHLEAENAVLRTGRQGSPSSLLAELTEEEGDELVKFVRSLRSPDVRAAVGLAGGEDGRG